MQETRSVPPSAERITYESAERAFAARLTESGQRHPLVRYEGDTVVSGRFVGATDDTVTLAVSVAGRRPEQRTYPMREGVDSLIPIGWVQLHPMPPRPVRT